MNNIICGNRGAVCIGATWGDMEGTLLSLDCQIKMRFCFTRTLLIEEPERDVKEGSVNCKSLYRGSIMELGGGEFYQGI